MFSNCNSQKVEEHWLMVVTMVLIVFRDCAYKTKTKIWNNFHKRKKRVFDEYNLSIIFLQFLQQLINQMSPLQGRRGFWAVFYNVLVGWNGRKEQPQERGISARRSALTTWLDSQVSPDEPNHSDLHWAFKHIFGLPKWKGIAK